jgi:hypothetical protein
MKEIDPDMSVYELTETHPELIPILKGMGFAGLGNPIARNTVGRATSLRKGCERQGKDLSEVRKQLEAEGFTIKM